MKGNGGRKQPIGRADSSQGIYRDETDPKNKNSRSGNLVAVIPVIKNTQLK
jgi:hypothetical protein